MLVFGQGTHLRAAIDIIDSIADINVKKYKQIVTKFSLVPAECVKINSGRQPNVHSFILARGGSMW